MGDALRIRQMLLNYLGNAIKFTETGTITCRAVALPESGSQITLRIEIEDSGKGIEAGRLAQLFQPFEQAEAGIALNCGTGLGLAVTRRLAELMGGSASATSEPGRGSRFWFLVQLKLRRSPAAHTAASGNADLAVTALDALKASCANARVLVVEDEPINLAVMLALLQSAFRRTHFAKDGEGAIKLAAHPLRPDPDGHAAAGSTGPRRAGRSGRCRSTPPRRSSPSPPTPANRTGRPAWPRG